MHGRELERVQVGGSRFDRCDQAGRDGEDLLAEVLGGEDLPAMEIVVVSRGSDRRAAMR